MDEMDIQTDGVVTDEQQDSVTVSSGGYTFEAVIQ